MKALVKGVCASPLLTRLGAARTRGGVLILNYHDIAADGDPTCWLRVPQAEFDRQLSLLERVGEFVTPDALAAAAQDGRHSAREGRLRLLLTFDDGYVNNRYLALPVLEKHGAPALFFVSTFHAATGEPFWFDRVVACVQADRRETLDLREFGLGWYGFATADDRHRWEDVERVLVAIKTLGNADDPRVDAILRRCEELSGPAARKYLTGCRPLGRDDLRAMRASGLCSFGSHGHRHEILTYLDDVALAANLAASRAYLEDALGEPTRDIAYPNGNLDGRVVRAVQEAGFKRGYTTVRGVARSGHDPLRLPRVLIGGYDDPTTLFWLVNRALLAGS